MMAPAHSGEQVLDVVGVLERMAQVVAEVGPEHADPPAVMRAEWIYHQLRDPDFDPPPITHVRDGHPADLIGRVLAAAGVSVEELESLDGSSWPVTAALDDRLGELTLTAGAQTVLALAQHEQDCGTRWGPLLADLVTVAINRGLLEHLAESAIAALCERVEQLTTTGVGS